MELVKRQDMPPQGGYKPITFHRVPARQFFNGYTLIGGYLAMTAAASYILYLTYRNIHFKEIEERSARFATLPLLLAERDRAYLKQLRINRDEERELMKNVKGWKVGMYYDEPVYKLTDKDALIEPTLVEYYVHAEYKEYAKRHNLAKWS